MQVLLMQNVPGIGNAGEVKKVADGYARNFLLPRKLAVVATEGAIRQSDAIKQAVVRREAKTRAEAEELAQLIEKVTLTFQAKAGEGDRLFGSITSGDIVDALAREKGITVDKRKIELASPLKELGNHPVAIKLHPDVTARVMVVVERQTA
jgi:large subunit ribosomal protein L9